MNTSASDFLNEFHIGTYHFQKNARTESHIRDIKECGIDLVFGVDNDKNVLDLFYKHGIYAIVSGVVPGWFGGNGNNAGTMHQTNKEEDYIKGLKAFEDHPAIIGIDAGDEPSSADFPYYGQVIDIIKEFLPSKLPYLNIYPSYGMLATNSKSQSEKELGASSYSDYIAAYCKNINLPYLSFDHYVFASDKERLLNDLAVNASYCQTDRKKLLVVLQVNSHEKEVFLSEEQISFQAFCAMAYGASAISWACYSAGWWYNPVLDINGNKTEQYQKLKNVNLKVRALSAEYIKYNWLNTKIAASGNKTEFDIFNSITASEKVLIGMFEKAEEERAIFVSPFDFKNSSELTLNFKLAKNKQVCLYRYDNCKKLTPEIDGTYTVSLNKSEACFITVT